MNEPKNSNNPKSSFDVTVSDIIKILSCSDDSCELYAPLNRQYDWDNSGQQVSFPQNSVKKIAFALEPTLKNINYAIENKFDVLVTHHPLLFSGVKSLSYDSIIGRKVMSAVSNQLSVLSFHTNLDLASYSTSDHLLNELGFTKTKGLEKVGEEKLYKVAVFTPKDYAGKVKSALFEAGAGQIGNYDSCAYETEGKGQFRPKEGSNPFIGSKDKLETVDELKIEVVVGEKNLESALQSMINAHPYEEPAYDVVLLNNKVNRYYLGSIGAITQPMNLGEFVEHVKNKLGLKHVKLNVDVVANKDLLISKIATIAGSGASSWKSIKSNKVNVLVTGDLKYHDAIDALENDIIIVDVGHYCSENIYMKYLASYVSNVVQKKFKQNITCELINLNQCGIFIE